LAPEAPRDFFVDGGRAKDAQGGKMVAQITGTYADINTWGNIYTAYRKAAKGKRGRHAAAAFHDTFAV
jgi:hypothetical protein